MQVPTSSLCFSFDLATCSASAFSSPVFHSSAAQIKVGIHPDGMTDTIAPFFFWGGGLTWTGRSQNVLLLIKPGSPDGLFLFIFFFVHPFVRGRWTLKAFGALGDKRNSSEPPSATHAVMDLWACNFFIVALESYLRCCLAFRQ